MTADEQPRGTANRSTLPDESAFTREIRTGWAERESLEVTEAKVAGFAAERRRAIGAMHPGSRIIIPAGDTKVRSNDTDYRFRPHSAFTHMTGWGSDAVPGAVLVLVLAELVFVLLVVLALPLRPVVAGSSGSALT